MRRLNTPLHNEPSIKTATVSLSTWRAATTTAFVAEPDSPGPHPGVVLGAEALGINTFMRDTAMALARLGYVAIVPDYFRGAGPSEPENYLDFTEVFAHIENLDFRQATYDLLAGLAWLRRRGDVDPTRTAVWGYCTGGTLAMLAACLDRELAGAVLFFPSQPVFKQLSPKRPSHPMDLVWNIACPVLVLYGENDYLMPRELLQELRHRLEQWQIEHEVRVYPGAGHSFTARAPNLYSAEASAAALRDARQFLSRHVPV